MTLAKRHKWKCVTLTWWFKPWATENTRSINKHLSISEYQSGKVSDESLWSFLLIPHTTDIDLSVVWQNLWSVQWSTPRLGVPKPNHFAFLMFFCLKLIFGRWHPPRKLWSEPRKSEPSILGYTGSADEYLTQFFAGVNKVRSESEPSWKNSKMRVFLSLFLISWYFVKTGCIL